MTSWRCATLLSLLVSLIKIKMSEEACHDYFNLKDVAENIAHRINLTETKDPKDTMECAVEQECLVRENLCHLLYHCFNREVSDKVSNTSEKCKGNDSREVSFYHFMCLTARALNYTPPGCEYVSTCNLHPTTASPGNTLQIVRNTTETQHGDKTNNSILTAVLMISVVFNVVGPLIVYLYMRPRVQRRQDSRTATPSNIPMVSVNGEGPHKETSHLIQTPACKSVDKQSNTRNDCDVQVETLH